MGHFLPLSKNNAPLTATLFTFVGPAVYGAVAAATTYFTALYYLPSIDGCRIIGVIVLVLWTLNEFRRIRLAFEADGEFSFFEMAGHVPLIATYWALVTAAGCASHPWLHSKLPEIVTSWGYPGIAKDFEVFSPLTALFVAVGAAVFLQVFFSYYAGSRTVRGEKVGTIKSIKQMLAKRRKRRDTRREDDILKRIHRDGGTGKIPKEDLDFLKSRSRTPRWQRS